MKQLQLFTGLVCAAWLGLAGAGPSSQVAWTLDTLQRVAKADPAKGKQIAQGCESCHAATPQNASSPYPVLQGQLATYLYKQLRDYKDGSRNNPIMAGMVASLGDQDMADVAAYYSREDRPDWSTSGMVFPDGVKQLVSSGDGKRILPPCKACHEADASGQKIDIPALAGQKAAYLEQTLLDYQAGARANDLYGRMRLITQQLSADEIKQLARYYAGSGR